MTNHKSYIKGILSFDKDREDAFNFLKNELNVDEAKFRRGYQVKKSITESALIKFCKFTHSAITLDYQGEKDYFTIHYTKDNPIEESNNDLEEGTIEEEDVISYNEETGLPFDE